ncbi:MAG: hypothetical protein EOL87_01980 [Spartobacteria bacterium]|nr:hypothetical protein [Spartobacteria bacterium]
MKPMQRKNRNICWTPLVAVLFVFVFLCSSGRVLGATVSLNVYSTVGFYQTNTTSYLVDGSIVRVIGSLDNSNDGFVTYGAGYDVDSTQGDDVYLGSGEISGDLGLMFATDIQFDDNDVKFVYFRIFQTTDTAIGSVAGSYVNWVTSGIYDAGSSGYSVLELAISDSYSTTNYDKFYVIPEPGVASILCFVLFVTIGVSRSVNQGGKKKKNLLG